MTGANGTLGRALVTQLQVQGHTVRTMTRRDPHQAATDTLTWVHADLATGGVSGEPLGERVTVVAALASAGCVTSRGGSIR